MVRLLGRPRRRIDCVNGKRTIFQGIRTKPQVSGKCFVGLNSGIPKHLPPFRGFNSCLETSSSGLLGSCLRYWQESLNRAIVHDREIMKPACEWVGVIQRPKNMGKSSKCRPDPTPLSSPTFIIDFIIFLTFCWGGLVFKSMGSGSRRSSYQLCGRQHVI